MSEHDINEDVKTSWKAVLLLVGPQSLAALVILLVALFLLTRA